MSFLISEKITLLNQTTLESLKEADKVKIVENFTKVGIKILGASFGFVWFKVQGKRKYDLAYKSPGTPYEPTLPRKRGTNDKVYRKSSPLFVSTVQKKQISRYDVSAYMKSYVIIPVIYKHHKYGTIVFCFKEKKDFSKEDKSLCTAMGNAIAQAITINKLYADLKEFSDTLDNTLDAIFIFDPKTLRISYVNRGAATQIGFTRKELIGKSFLSLQNNFSHEALQKIVKPLLTGKSQSVLFESELIAKDGSVVPVEMLLQYVLQAHHPNRFLSIVRHIGERKEAEKTIKKMAYYDGLTGLPNRMLFSEKLDQALKRVKDSNRRLGIMFLDMDRFKFVNDTLGHIAGDKLLYLVGRRLVACVDKSATVARMGGDEFIVLLPSIQDYQQAAKVAEKIYNSFKQPFELEMQEVYANASIGISVYPEDGKDSSSLMKNADLALHRAKEEGGGDFQRYSTASYIPQFSRLDLEKQLRRALRNNELVINYQPQLDLKTSQIVSAEALVRWQHPTLGLILPDEFMSQAEENGLIVPIGEWVIRQTCMQNKLWQDAGLPKIPISVNVSPRQLLQKDLPDLIDKVLKDVGLEAHFLELELTESVLMRNMDLAVQILQQFRASGIKFLIDDFGTGYASLSYLQKLPIDKVKIDKSFVQVSPFSAQESAIISAIIAIAKKLHFKVVAEGVETSEQCDFLKKENCDIVQGNFFSKPLSVEEFTRFLKKSI